MKKLTFRAKYVAGDVEPEEITLIIGDHENYSMSGYELIDIQDIKLVEDECEHEFAGGGAVNSVLYSRCNKCGYIKTGIVPTRDKPEKIEELETGYGLILHPTEIADKLNEVIRAYNKLLKKNHD